MIYNRYKRSKLRLEYIIVVLLLLLLFWKEIKTVFVPEEKDVRYKSLEDTPPGFDDDLKDGRY